MGLRYLIQRILFPPGSTVLPLSVIFTLFFVLLFQAMTTTMVFSYLPQLILSFGFSEVEKGTYVGLVASSMFVSLAFSSFIWGHIADMKGKKTILIINCIGVSLTTLAFGFSDNIYWAVVSRFLQGCFGLLVATQTLLFEMCDETNKPLAMAVCLSAYSTGLVLGPSIGGYLAFPNKSFPSAFTKDSFFVKFASLLPNLFLSIGLLICIPLIIMVVPSSQTKKEQYLGNPTINASTDDIVVKKSSSNLKRLLKNKLCWQSSFTYALFQFFAIGFNELYPIWASTTRKYNGLNLSTSQIGTSLMVAAAVLVPVQPILLTRIARWFGVRNIFIISLLAQAILYPLYPPISLIHNWYGMWTALSVNIIATRIAVGACFLGVSVIINDSVDEDLIGAANGLGMTLAGIGRIASPTIFGHIFSWSLSNIKSVDENDAPYGFPLNQYFPFLIMTVLAIINAYLVSLLPSNKTINNAKDKMLSDNNDQDKQKLMHESDDDDDLLTA